MVVCASSYQLQWQVYLVKCADDSYYCGMSKNVSKRVDSHNRKSSGAKYTRSRRPVTLAWTSKPCTRRDAARLEYRIKKLTHRQKEVLSVTNNLDLVK